VIAGAKIGKPAPEVPVRLVAMPTFEPGQVVTVFRSYRNDAHADEYAATVARMIDLAQNMPGFVDYKSFVADDGERVSLATFESLDAQSAWRDHLDHRKSQEAGRDRFYDAYSLQVCTCDHTSAFTAPLSQPSIDSM
jgi:heme-degrading monooxygenase HmoA